MPKPANTPLPNTPDAPANILVFDSGVGGLSIAAEIHRQLPHCNITYCSDNAAFPYGTKTEAELTERVDAVLKAVCTNTDIDIIVVACNSASTLTLPHIRRHFKQPVVGVVPAIKPAAELSNNKRIGLLATPGTISRPYTHKLIADFASNCFVVPAGSSELVSLAEQKLRGQCISQAQLQPILQPLKDKGIDTLVLACTHFPLLSHEIQTFFGPNTALIDSSAAIARRVEHLLNTHTTLNNSGARGNKSIFTANTCDIDSLKPALAQFDLGDIHFLDT